MNHLMKRRYLSSSDVETGVLGICREKSGSNLHVNQTVSGVATNKGDGGII